MQDFQATTQVNTAFGTTQPAHLSMQDRFRENGASTVPPGMHKLARNAGEDHSMNLIIVVAVLLTIVGFLPQFIWFQKLTAIYSWTEFLSNLFGTGDVLLFMKNVVGLH